MRGLRAVLACLLLAGIVPAHAGTDPPKDPCERLRTIAGNRDASIPADGRVRGDGPLRVFAIQYKQMVDYVDTYDTFALKMDCLMKDYVVPFLDDPTKTNLVVFNEDIGLATLATGSRGAAARAFASSPVPGDTPALYDQTGVPAGAAAALGSVPAAHAPQIAAYRMRYPDEDPRKAIITAATDTFVRGFMTTFSRLARTYHVWIVASNNQAEFNYSTAPEDIAAFADPDLRAQYLGPDPALRGVWVAAGARAWNNAFLWGPDTLDGATIQSTDDPASPEYDPRSNLLYTNKKTPLTQIEKDFLALDDGDMSPVSCGGSGSVVCTGNAGAVTIPGLAGFRFGFAISLPAFMYGDPQPGHECDDGSTWMRCLDARGVNTVIQPEANPGPWARYGADGGRFQAQTWGASTIRAVTDDSVSFKYIVCPHMVGNLVDLPFDGQTAILERDRQGPGRAHVGSWAAEGPRPGYVGDGDYAIYAGPKPEFVALSRWVADDPSTSDITADRAALAEVATALMPGSLDPRSNGYLETAIFADLSIV